MASIQFISPQYIKDNSIVEDNVNEKIIDPVIEQVQEITIHPYLGSNLYDALQTEASNSNLTGNRKKLVDEYIIPILLNSSVDQLIPTLNYKFTNRSIEKQAGDNSQSANKEELEYLRTTYRSVANTYIVRMQDFIADNIGDFPEYNDNTTEDVNAIVDSNSAAGIYTGRYSDDAPDYPAGYSYPGRYRRIN